MEHSYTRDSKPKEVQVESLATRTIMVERPPPCPSCHLESHGDDKLDASVSPIKSTLHTCDESDEETIMVEAENAIRNCCTRNNCTDEDDWAMAIDKSDWSQQQLNLFKRVERILDLDQMARLAYAKRSGESLKRRSSIDKSASRMRQALATVQWDATLTQWLHALLIDYLSPNYMVSYMEILQSLKQKTPTLVNRMFDDSTVDMNCAYSQVIATQPWQPSNDTKTERLPGQVVIIVIPPSPIATRTTKVTSRLHRWYQMLAGLASVVPIRVNPNTVQDQPMDKILEHIVATTRDKIKDIHDIMSNAQIVLVGFNAGAAIALQVAMGEEVAAVVSIGFAYNTVNGVRGMPDDLLLGIKSPVLFVLGQNAQRSR